MSGVASARRGARQSTGKLVIRLQFVTLKRLETRDTRPACSRWRAAVGIAERSNLFRVTTRTRSPSKQPGHLQAPVAPAACATGSRHARVYDGAQRMIAAFGPRHDDVGVVRRASRCVEKRRA